jgi:AcrR family transcriptional regulator
LPVAAQRPRKRARRLTREEKSQETFERLLAAAEDVVGSDGYAAASISKIAAKAGVAQGTFYNYFETRQDLFDILLPHVGQKMLDYISTAFENAPIGAAREEARFRAFCDYLADNPGFYRILYEAEVHAPEAHMAHIDSLVEGFRRALDRSVERGEIKGYTKEELEAVVYMFLGARAYVAMRYIRGGKRKQKAERDSAISAYAKLVSKGLFSNQ